jgi:hypothetical protein
LTSKTPPEVSKLLNTIGPDSSSSKNYSRISSYKLYKWQINTKNDHIIVMNAIVFLKFTVTDMVTVTVTVTVKVKLMVTITIIVTRPV